jgi:hypothetical protein
MTEEPTMRLFAVTLIAWRSEDDQPRVALRTIIVLLAGEADLEQKGIELAKDLFPTADGWNDQSSTWTEIPQGMSVGPLRLTWRADPSPAAENEGAEP